MPYYAQINEGGICIAVTETSGVLEPDPLLVEIDGLHTEYAGEFYDPVASSAAGVPIFVKPVAPEQVPDLRLWWVDVGPFYDRFGADALAIAASDHGACKAVQTLTGVRKYIDLKDQRVAAMIDMLIETGQPAAVAYAPGSGPMTAAKKTAILTTPTTEAERFIKGLV